MSRTNILRELLNRDEITVAPGVYDAYLAKLASTMGFESIGLGGYAVGASTGATEPMINATEMADRSLELINSIELPIVVDAGAGFGHPPHVYRTVRTWAKIGIAGLHIEDAVYPKRLHYHAGEVNLIETNEMVKKIEAAVNAREEMDEDIFIIARSDAARRQRRREHGETIEDAVERLNTYVDAGAEAAMVWPKTKKELQFAVDNIDAPVSYSLIPSYEPQLTIEECDQMGVARASLPITATVATHKAVKEQWKYLLENGEPAIKKDEYAKLRSEIEEVINLPKFQQMEEEAGFKTSDELWHEGKNE